MEIEEQIKELENVVTLLENGNISLDESTKLFEKGMNLAKNCNKALSESEKKITILLENEKEENFEIE